MWFAWLQVGDKQSEGVHLNTLTPFYQRVNLDNMSTSAPILLYLSQPWVSENQHGPIVLTVV